MRQAGALGMELHGEAKLAQAGIGLVVTDDQVAARLQGGQNRCREATVAAPSTPTCQGRSSPFMRGVKLWMAISAGILPARRNSAMRRAMARW